MEEIEHIKKEIEQEYSNTIDFENAKWKIKTMEEVEEDLKTFFNYEELSYSNASWKELDEMFSDEEHYLKTSSGVKFIYNVKHNEITIVKELIMFCEDRSCPRFGKRLDKDGICRPMKERKN